MLGAIVLVYAISRLTGVRVPAPAPLGEKFWTACVGFLFGMLCGFAAYFGPPVIMYLLALKVTKEEFVSCAGMLYLVGIMPASATLVYKGVLSKPDLMLSGIGVILI